MRKHLKISSLSAALLAGTLAGCGGSPAAPGASIGSIELSPAAVNVVVGGTATLNATAKTPGGQVIPNVTFAWKSSNDTIASVANGVLSDKASGSAQVTASAGGVTSAPATVNVAPAANFDLSLSADRLPVLTGGSASLRLTLTRTNGFAGAVTVTPSGLPAGATGAPVTIPVGQTSATLTFQAAGNAPHSLPTAVTLTAASGAQSVTKPLILTVRGPAGSLDTSFAAGGRAITAVGNGEDVAQALAVQADGKLIAVGSSVSAAGTEDFAVVRYERDGTLDATFGTGGKVLIDFAGKPDLARAVAVQDDGKIVVAGSATSAANEEHFALARLNPNGSLDAAFGTGGKATATFSGADRAQAVLLTPSGIVVGGQASFGSDASGVDYALARFTNAGTLDASFGSGGKVTTSVKSGNATDSVRALARQGDKIVAVGGEGDFTAARFTNAGTLDASFGSGGRIGGFFESSIGTANAVLVDAQGRLVLAGQSQNDTALVRLSANGTLDDSFGEGGQVVLALSADNWDAATALALQSDGKLVLGGWVYEGSSSAGNFALTRLLPNGQRDASFGEGGTTVTSVAPGSKADEARALVLQSDERVPIVRAVLAGVRNDQNQDFALTRYWP